MKSTKEEWRAIPNYPDYQVSNYGEVKSLKFGREKLLKPRTCSTGRLQVALCKDGKCKSIGIHRLVAYSFLEHKPCGYEKVIDHIDNNPLNNRSDNLQIISHRLNTSKDQWRNNRASKYIGVSKNRARWAAKISIKSRNIHIGTFDTELEASKAYQSKLATL